MSRVFLGCCHALFIPGGERLAIMTRDVFLDHDDPCSDEQLLVQEPEQKTTVSSLPCSQENDQTGTFYYFLKEARGEVQLVRSHHTVSPSKEVVFSYGYHTLLTTVIATWILFFFPLYTTQHNDVIPLLEALFQLHCYRFAFFPCTLRCQTLLH